MSARIKVLSVDQTARDTLCAALGLPHFIVDVLVSRGIVTPEEAERFLHPDLERDWRNPYDIDHMGELIDSLVSAIKQNKTILVFGDFDLDGISATALLTRALRTLEASVIPFIPLRFEEGYGLSSAAIDRLLTYKPDIVITVDNGIAARDEVKRLQNHGIDVLITDHHEPSELVPQGVPVVDPKCQDIPSDILSGVGVALKVVQALGARFGKPYLWLDLVDLATLGTVADLMPMVDENRALVARGIEMINTEPRVCIAALIAQAGIADQPVTSTNLSFTLVPRLNAAGRMGNAQLALDLLLCDEYGQACLLAKELETTNTERRAIESELAQVAFEQAEQTYQGRRALVVSGKDWHEGVKGIVASRLCNRYGVPSILFTIDRDEARGSGRSVGEVNLFKAIESCKDLLTRFGGHEAAVGVTLPAALLPQFYERLCAYMDTLDIESFTPRITVDACVDFSELTLDNVRKLEMLAPYGQENPIPHFLAQNVLIAKSRAVGADKSHLSCTLTDGLHFLSGIMFHCDGINELMSCSQVVNAVFELQVDTWRGNQSVKAIISSLEPVTPCGALSACLEQESIDFMRTLLEERTDVCCVSELADSSTPSATYIHETPKEANEVVSAECEERDKRVYWEQLAATDKELLRKRLVEAFIGEGALHLAQQEVLDCLEAGRSVLALMGTGRGKSLIFQIYAAEQALTHHEVSLFIYPLRALISDQVHHLQKALQQFGLKSAVLMGATPQSDRARINAELKAGTLDIVLTTPEYALYHVKELSQASHFGFVVVDEAHHIGTSKAGFRPSYTKLAHVLEVLGNPRVLALTATANEAIQNAIVADLSLDDVVIDNTVRTNLLIDDKRNIKNRMQYLVSLVAQGETTIVYVNSRTESLLLARALREAVPHIAVMIGFYNAGLSREERKHIEELFRTKRLQVLIATSAFGEGVNIPNVRHVVLYHMPFSEVEFNQMAGRAGRDGLPAYIHLLFGEADAAINEAMLANATPDHDYMAQVYRELRREQRDSGASDVFITLASVTKQSNMYAPLKLLESHVVCGLQVFSELGLIKAEQTVIDNGQIKVHIIDYKGKVELVSSARYKEGLDERASFESFKEWILRSNSEELQERIQRPLLP